MPDQRAETAPSVTELFGELVDLSADQRAARLSALRHVDPAAAKELEQRLAADAAAEKAGLFPLGADAGIPPGHRAAGFRFVRPLPKGGQADVYLAVRLASDVAYVVKVLPKPPDRGDPVDELRRRRFAQEARVLGRLRHPHVAPFLEPGRTADGSSYLAVTYVDGWSLDQFVVRRLLAPGRGGTDPLLALLRLFVGLARAVQYAHEQGVLHRDIKPDNVRVDQQGNPFLIDFGIAALTAEDGGEDGTLTQAGHFVGTPRWTSPEQFDGQRDPRSDVYSLGVMLHQMIRGGGGTDDCFPYDVNCPRDQIVRNARSKARRSATGHGSPLIPTIEPALDHIVHKAIRHDPRHRYGSAEAFAVALEHHIARLLASAAATPTHRPVARWQAWVAAALLCFPVLAGIWYRSRPPRPAVAAPPHRSAAAEATVAEAMVAPPVSSHLAIEMPSDQPINYDALRTDPSTLKGVLQWTVETRLPRQDVRALAFSTDHARLAVGGWDRAVRVWSRSSAHTDLTVAPDVLLATENQISSLAWQPGNSHVLAVGGPSGPVGLKVWDVDRGGGLWSAPEEAVVSLAWSPDGRTLAAACADAPAIHRWSIDPAGRFVRQRDLVSPSAQPWQSVAFSPDGTTLAAGSRSGELVFFDAGTGRRILTDVAKLASDSVVGWSPDGERFAAAGTDGATPILRVYDGRSLRHLATHTGGGRPIGTLAWSPDSRFVATAGGSPSRTLLVWDAVTGDTRSISAPDDAVLSVAWSPDGELVWGTAGAAVGAAATPLPVGQVRVDVFAGVIPIFATAISPTTRRVAINCGDGTMRLWSPPDRRSEGLNLSRPVLVQGALMSARDVEWSPDGRRLAAVGRGDVAVWDVASRPGLPIRTIRRGESEFQRVWISNDGVLAVATDDGRVVGYAPESTAAEPVVLSGGPPCTAGAFSPDATRFAVGNADGSTLLVNSRDGKGAIRLKWAAPPGELTGGVTSFAWSPSGRFLMVSTEDQSVRLWDVAAERVRVTRPSQMNHGASAMCWTPGGVQAMSPSATTFFALADPEHPERDGGWTADPKRELFPKENVNVALGGVSDDGQWGFGTDYRPDDVSHVLDFFRLLPAPPATPYRLRVLLTPPNDVVAFSADSWGGTSPAAAADLRVVVQTSAGQTSMSPAEFDARYRHRSEPLPLTPPR